LTSTEGNRPATALCSRNRTRGLLIAVGALGIVALLSFFLLDPIAPEFCKAHTKFLAGSTWAGMFRQLGKVWAPVWLLFLYVWATGKRRALIAGILALVLSSSVTLVKVAVSRPRPDQPDENDTRQLAFYYDKSFPSGDTASAFALATAASTFVPGAWQVLLFAGAAAVGILRVLSVKHFPSDVLAGAAFGILCGWCAIILSSKLTRRGPPRRWRCARWLFVAVLVFPLLELITRTNTLLTFITGFGPMVACVLLVAKGDVWLRWLRSATPPQGRTADSASSRISNLPDRRARWAVIVLIAVVALATLPNLGWTTLYDRDEGYYAECAREMIVRGDPFIPHFSGQPWLEKPPLTYWLMALSMRVLGETEFAARLPSALAGLLAMWLTFLLARRMFFPLAGVIAAAVLGTSGFFSATMRLALLDNVLVCCTLLSMIGLWKLLKDQGGAYMFWAGCGLGVLAKGPLGFALPLIALAGVLLWTRQWQLLKRLRPAPGLLLALAIFGVWAIPANWLTHGDYFYEVVWMRTLRPVFIPLQGHGGSTAVGYLALLPAYIPILLVGFLPWSALLVPVVRHMAAEERRGARVGLLAGWLFAQLAVFSLVSTKLPNHVLPLVPPMAIATGAFLAGVLTQRPGLRRLWGLSGRLVFLTGFLLFGTMVTVAPAIMGFPLARPWFLPAAVVAIAGACWTVALPARRDTSRALMGTVVTMLLSFSLLWQLGLPYLEKTRAPRRIANVLEEHFGKEELRTVRLALMKFNQPSFVFYVKKPASKLSTPADLDLFLASPGPAAVVLPEKSLKDTLDQHLAAQHRIVWQERVWLDGKWENVIVITNESPHADTSAPVT